MRAIARLYGAAQALLARRLEVARKHQGIEQAMRASARCLGPRKFNLRET